MAPEAKKKGAPASETCAESKAGWCRTVSEAAQANAVPEGPWEGRARACRHYLGPFRMEIAPEAHRKGGLPAWDLRKIQGRVVSHHVRGSSGIVRWAGPRAGRVKSLRINLGPF